MKPFYKTIKITLIFCFLVLNLSCSYGDLNSDLQGTWNIYNASRNGRPTATFENGFIKFWNNDTLETNLTGELTKTNYKLSNKMIKTDDKLPVFNVINFEKDTMSLQFIIQETHFHLVLSKFRS